MRDEASPARARHGECRDCAADVGRSCRHDPECRIWARCERRGEGPERPVCKTCGDTHTMRLGEDREVPCTRCPVPCERCRSGAYCATAPCACECHQRKRGRK
jgi:hypothetical protein